MKKLSGLFGTLFVIAIVAFSTRFMWMGTVKAMLWNGESTFVCDGNQDISMSGKKADVIGGPAIEISGNCTLECDDCTLKGEVGVLGKSNGKLVLKGGSVEGQEAAFSFQSNASINVTSSTIKGVIGIDASESANGKFELRAVTIEAKEAAVDLGGNSKLDARGSTINGAVGIRVGSNAKATIRGGSLTGTVNAIEQKSNAKVIIKDKTKVTGTVKSTRKRNIEGLTTN